MRTAILLGLLVGVVCGEISPQLGYHENVGIPEAARIKEAEDVIVMRSVADDANRIVGGVVATANAHPYLGGLVISLVGIAGNSVCGSSLLTASRAVTAAHCWSDGRNQAWQFVIVLGSQMLFYGGTRVATSNVVVHPSWNPATLANDVAMIYLPTNVAFTQSIQPISLPSTTQLWESFAGAIAVAAGYGKTTDQQQGVTLDTQVSQVAVRVITIAECQAVFGGWALTSNVCTNGAGGIGICGGDSGGPLVVNNGGQNILIGISSFVAAAGCQLGFPSAFARVTSFYVFIVSHLV